MTCNICKTDISPVVFSMTGPVCDRCRHPPLVGEAKAASDAAWAAMMARIAAMPDQWRGWETAAPDLGATEPI